MHSMLFVASVLTPSTAGDDPWKANQQLRDHVTNTARQYRGVERLADNVCLVNMRIDPLPLALLCNAAHQLGIAFRLLPFAEEPQWLPTSAGPTP